MCWCFRTCEAEADWLSSGAENNAGPMWAGLQSFPHGRRPGRRSHIWRKSPRNFLAWFRHTDLWLHAMRHYILLLFVRDLLFVNLFIYYCIFIFPCLALQYVLLPPGGAVHQVWDACPAEFHHKAEGRRGQRGAETQEKVLEILYMNYLTV